MVYPGQDSIHCDGNCTKWLHRGCAGLTKEALFVYPNLRNHFIVQTADLTEPEGNFDTK